jgi:benzoyl-CoA reductase subunit B
MYMDKYLFTGGPFPIMDFIWSNRNCPCGHPKWHVLISEHQGIPMMAIDDEFHHQHSGEMGQRNEYLIGQYLDSIDWLEKVSGRKYDDAKAIEAMKLYYEMECVWGEINVLLSTVPAPVDFKSLMSFVPIQMEMREKPEALEFMKRFRDEVKDRIANKIAAVPNETYRMAMNGIPPWSTLSLFRKLEKYGVVFVTSGAYLIWAKVIYHDDGTITAAKTPEEMGWPEDKNREDMLKTFARWKTELYDHFVVDVDDQVKYTVQLMKFTKIDGAVINIDRGCPPATLGLIDYKIALTEAGIPTVMTEMNHADFRENDEALMMQNIETFLDCQLSE